MSVWAVSMSLRARLMELTARLWFGFIRIMVLFLNSSSKLMFVTDEHDEWFSCDVGY